MGDSMGDSMGAQLDWYMMLGTLSKELDKQFKI